MITKKQHAPRDMQPAVLIVSPNDSAGGKLPIHREIIGLMPNMGIMYLGAVLDAQGFPVVTRDYGLSSLSPLQIAGEIAALNPILVGFTMFESNVQSIRVLVSLLRLFYSGTIVVGGYTATSHAEDVLSEIPAVDLVVLREGEEAIVALMEHLAGERSLESVPSLVYRDGGAIRMTEPAPLTDITKLPWPRRDWDAPYDVTPIIGRRGCYGRCAFCSMVSFYDSSLGPLVRRREVIDVVDEIENCMQHGRNDLMFYDDCFGMSTRTDQEWCTQFIREVTRRRLHFSLGIELRVTDVIRGASLLREMCDLGLSHIDIGMETMLPRQLALYNKGYRQKDIFQAVEVVKTLPLDYQNNVIFWDPWLTLEEAAEHVALLDQIGIQNQLIGANYPCFGSRVVPRRGTGLHNVVKAAGLLVRTPNSFSGFSFNFVHQRTAKFYDGPYFNLMSRLRKIPRPSALWLRVLRLNREGQQARAQALRRYGSAITHTAFDYFRTMLNTLRQIEDPVEAQRAEQDIHQLFAPKLDSIAELMPLDERDAPDLGDLAETRPEAVCAAATV